MWNKLGSTDRRRKKVRFTVLFDGECGVCLSAVERLKRWDRDGRLSFLAARDPGVADRFPNLSPEALEEAIHLVDAGGRVWVGSEAVEKLVEVLPGWRWARVLFQLPLARVVVHGVYRWVARNRYRLSCQDHCGSGSPPA